VLTLDNTPGATWFRCLSRWALFTGIAYSGLVLAIFALVLPASQNSPLPERYFELVAASREPVLYRLTIALDVAAWLTARNHPPDHGGHSDTERRE
jgi:hypothetical protein